MHNLEDLRAETIRITGANGAELEAYLAGPLDDQPHAGVVVIHHMPGWQLIFRFFGGHLAPPA